MEFAQVVTLVVVLAGVLAEVFVVPAVAGGKSSAVMRSPSYGAFPSMLSGLEGYR